MYRQQDHSIEDSVSKERIAKNWKMKKSNATSQTSLGWGHEMVIDESRLLDNNGNQAVVTADGYLLSPYKAVVLYVKVDSPSGNPKTQGWYVYVQNSNEYVLTSDTSVRSGTNYFMMKVVTQVQGGTEKMVIGRCVED